MFEDVEKGGSGVGQKRKKNFRTVQRRQGHQIENAERQIHNNDGRGYKIKVLGYNDKTGQKTNNETKNNREDKVGGHARGCDGKRAKSLVFKISRIIGHWLGPAEKKSGVRQH